MFVGSRWAIGIVQSIVSPGRVHSKCRRVWEVDVERREWRSMVARQKVRSDER